MRKIKPRLVSEESIHCGRTAAPQYLTGPDMVGGLVSAPLFYVFPQGLDTDRMKQSLATVLKFYPVIAGRLKKDANGHGYVDVNDAGVHFYEYEVEGSLPEYGPDHPMQKDLGHYFKRIMPWHAYRDDTALFTVRVFRFADGGVVLSLVPIHVIIDASSIWGFLQDWSRVANGEGDPEPIVEREWLLEFSQQHTDLPYRRGILKSYGLWPRLVIYARLLLNMRHNNLAIYRLSTAYIASLQAQLREEFPDAPRVNDADLVTAHCLKVIAGLRGYQTDLCVGVVMDLRFKRLGVPKRLFGVALAQEEHEFTARELAEKSPSALAVRMRQPGHIQTAEDWKGFLGFLETHRQKRSIMSLLPNSVVRSLDGGFMQNNYCPMPVYGLDLGTGPSSWYTPESMPYRMVKLVPTAEGDGSLDLHLVLNKRELKAFEEMFAG